MDLIEVGTALCCKYNTACGNSQLEAHYAQAHGAVEVGTGQRGETCGCAQRHNTALRHANPVDVGPYRYKTCCALVLGVQGRMLDGM